jgi:hypothetical protein
VKHTWPCFSIPTAPWWASACRRHAPSPSCPRYQAFCRQYRLPLHLARTRRQHDAPLPLLGRLAALVPSLPLGHVQIGWQCNSNYTPHKRHALVVDFMSRQSPSGAKRRRPPRASRVARKGAPLLPAWAVSPLRALLQTAGFRLRGNDRKDVNGGQCKGHRGRERTLSMNSSAAATLRPKWGQPTCDSAPTYRITTRLLLAPPSRFLKKATQGSPVVGSTARAGGDRGAWAPVLVLPPPAGCVASFSVLWWCLASKPAHLACVCSLLR